MEYIWLIYSTILILNLMDSEEYSHDDLQDLHTKLFVTNSYNKKIRPLVDQDTVLNISINFHLSAITQFEEQDESLSTAGYLQIKWTDEFLTWNPDDNNDINWIIIPQDDIWKPDVTLHNSYSPFKGLGSSHLNAWIRQTGLVQWEPFQVLKSTCSVDITYFPFDAQKCSMVFVVWSYTHVEIELLTQNGFVLAEYSGSSTWEIVSAVSEFNNNLYIPKATFTLNLQRKPLFYMLNMVIPIIFLSIMNIFTFTLPAKSGERASYAVTLFLSISVFLTIIAAEFPKNSDNLSYLALYLTIMTSISTIFVIITVLQLRLLNREETNCPVGGCYRCIYKLVKCLRCKTCKPRPSCKQRSSKVSNLQSHDNGIDESLGEGNEKVTWPDVIDAIDFLCFWIGSVVTFTVTITILLALLNNPDRH